MATYLSEVIEKKTLEIESMSVTHEKFADACKGLKTLIDADEECAKNMQEAEDAAEEAKERKKWKRIEVILSCIGTVTAIAGAITTAVSVGTHYKIETGKLNLYEAKLDAGYDFEYKESGLMRSNTIKDLMNNIKA